MMQKTASALMVLVLASCGSSSGGGSTPSGLVDRFVGTWTIGTGALMATCPAPIPPINTPLTGDQTVEKGTASDLIFDVQPMCHLLVDVSTTNASVATVRPAQMCTVSANGTPVQGTVQSGTLTLTGTNVTATFELAGTAPSPLGGGTCNFTATGTSAKKTLAP
jgi:hypothetical protein